MNNTSCHVCGAEALYEHEGYRNLKRVTSDCKPWSTGGRLCTCETCGCTQVVCDEAWRKSIQSIYCDYTIYYQGEGEEQKIFDLVTNRMWPRSEWLLKMMKREVQLPEKGRALDFGCGNGRFLKAFGAAYPTWKLAGVEFDAKYRSIVEALPGVEKLYTEADLPTGFDFISLIHVLEHIENPISFLKKLRTKLLSNGLLFVELPSYENNPFELLIADHATHYSLKSAQWVLQQAGFSSLVTSDQWLSKELSLLGRAKEGITLSYTQSSPELVEAAISWLHHVVAEANKARKQGKIFGILGTSIAGTWLANELGDMPDFFVDEDQNRIGRMHMGVPIYAPSNAPDKSIIFIAQPESISTRIVARLKRRENVVYHYAISQ